MIGTKLVQKSQAHLANVVIEPLTATIPLIFAKLKGWLPEFDEGLFGVTVERVMVGQDKLIFEFKDGYTTEYKL